MTNMFSGKINTKIPKNLSECISPDATVSNLHTWAERLENWGKILFWLLILGGLITAVVTSIIVEEVVVGIYNQRTEAKTTFDVILFFTSIAETALYAFLEYCAYHVLALLVSALASITQNNIISANIALYVAAKDSADPEPSQAAPTKPSSIPTSSTTEKPTQSNTPITPEISENNTIICPVCGTNQNADRTVCWSCGQKFAKRNNAQTSNKLCEMCGNGSLELTYCEIKDTFGTRYRHICNDCKDKYNAKEKPE